jgi:hypothetical protein
VRATNQPDTREYVMSHQLRNNMMAIYLLGLAAMASGCTADAGDDASADDTSTVAQGIQCQDSACDGILPQSSSCILDPALSIVADGQVFNGGVQIGGIGLYYSPACHTIWAATAFYQPQSHRTCAVRRAAVNESVCQDYTGSLGNNSPMRHLAIGKTGFGRTVLLTNSNVTGRTGDFTRSF